MRILASFLTLLIAVHGVCMAQCVAERSLPASPKTAPPCHHEKGGQDEGDSPVPSAICSEGLGLEAKTLPILKYAPSADVVSSGAPALASLTNDVWHGAVQSEAPPAFLPLVRLSVLRI